MAPESWEQTSGGRRHLLERPSNYWPVAMRTVGGQKRGAECSRGVSTEHRGMVVEEQAGRRAAVGRQSQPPPPPQGWAAGGRCLE